MTDTNTPSAGKSQLDKFKDAARQLECDEDEAAFEGKLRRIAKAPPTETETQNEEKPAD